MHFLKNTMYPHTEDLPPRLAPGGGTDRWEHREWPCLPTLTPRLHLWSRHLQRALSLPECSLNPYANAQISKTPNSLPPKKMEPSQ